MSIDFTILCTESPAKFLKKKAHWLKWDAKASSGSFAGMYLSQRPLREEDPLPAPEWAERVVAVLHADGRLSEETFDDFDSWITALARATRGAVYSHQSGKFDYVWADLEEPQTRERAGALLAAGDFGALARWVDELGEKHAARKQRPSAPWAQLCWIDELTLPVIEQRIAAGDASAAPAILALHRVFAKSSGTERHDALAIAAAGLPALAGDRALQKIAADLAAEKMRALANLAAEKMRALGNILPASLDELNLLLDGVEREDPLSLLRLGNFIGQLRDYTAPRYELVAALAASGRALPEPLMKRLAEPIFYLEALKSAPARAEFAKHGAMARMIADRITRNEVESKLAAERDAREAAPRISQARAWNDAYYGPARKRPRMPEDIVALVRKRSFEEAIIAYRARFPEFASQAEQAIEDMRAYLVSL